MSDAYEPFLIPVEVIGGKDAESTLKNIDSKLKEISENLIDVGYGADAMKILTANMRDLSSVSKTVASGISTLNKANAQAAKDAESVALAHQKVATEAGKTARELEKAKTQAANTAIANQRLSTEMEKTVTAHTRAEMAALRVAQAHEKQALKAQQAALPYNKLNQELKEQAQKIKDVIAGTLQGNDAYKRNDYTLQRMVNHYKNLKDELDTTNAKFNALTGSIKQTQTAGMAFASFLGNLAADAIQRVIYSLGNMVQEISKAGIALDGITNTFAAGARGWKQGSEEMEWVAKTAETLGLNLQSTYEPYAKFMTSFTRSGGTLQESRQIFEDLSTAMVSLHLSSDQMNNVFVALEQMANKGTVQSEELKRQLGNALPGAFELAAQSMNVTTAELMDMMKAGEVVSRDFLPNFAALVKDSLGTQIGIAVNQYNAHLNRLKSQTFLLQSTMGQILNEALTPFVQGLTGIARATNLLIKSFGDTTTAATALQVVFVGLGVVLGSHIIKMSAATVASVELALAEGKITPALALFQKGLISVNSLLTTNITMSGLATAASNALKTAWSAIAAHPIGAVLIAVGAAALYCTNSINKVNKEIAEGYVQIQDYSNNLTGLISEYSQLAEIENKTTAQQEAYNRVLGDLSTQYPAVIQYIQDNGINLKNLTQEQADNIASLGVLQATQEAEKQKLKELTNGWKIFGTRVKQVGKGILWVVQVIEAAIAHAVIALGQIFTRTASVIMKSYEWVYDKLAKGANLLGQKELATQFEQAENYAKKQADKLWDIGKQAHSNLNGALGELWKDIGNVEVERIEKAEKNFKDSLAKIGQDQSKLAQQLMYSSNNLVGVATGEQGKKKGKGEKGSTTKEEKTEWDNLTQLISKQEEEIKVLKLAGQENKNLEESYAKNIQKRKEIEDYVNKITAAGEGEVSMWKRLKKAADDANATYENRLSNSLQYTDSQIEEARQSAKSYNAIVKYAEAQKNANGILQITSRTAKQLTNDLVDGLFTPLQEAETIWSRFKDAGISAIKAIATEWVKNKLNMILTGFQGGWAIGQQGGGTLGQKFIMGMLGAGQGAKGQTLLGTATNQTFGNNSYIASAYQGFLQKMGGFTNAANTVNNSAFNTMNSGALQLANTLNSATSPAVGTVTNAVMGVANPAVMAANAIANMAVSAPIAATSMGVLGTIMTTAGAGFMAAAPALTAMGAAMAKIAASASTAAKAMAAYAVAAAAASVARIPIIGAVLAPIAALATGTAIAAGTAMTGAAIGASTMLAGGGQMLGGAMSGIGNKLSGVSGLSKGANVVPHAKGGIVSSPTMFPMQGGNIGLAGEAGTEVIAPARRMSNGEVGIGAIAPQVTVNNYTNAAVEVKKRPDNSMEIKISELNSMLSSSKTNKGMSVAQSRLQQRGRQIG